MTIFSSEPFISMGFAPTFSETLGLTNSHQQHHTFGAPDVGWIYPSLRALPVAGGDRFFGPWWPRPLPVDNRKLALRYPVFDNIEATHGNSSTNLCSIASLGSNMLNAFGSISQ